MGGNMHKYVWIVFGIGLLFGVSACGSDGGSDPRGSGGTSGGMATVTGVVTIESAAGNSTVQGATVGQLGTTNTTVSDMNGAFSLDVPVGTVMFETTAPPAWGEILADEVPAEGLEDLDPELLAEDLIAEVEEALGPVDVSKGVVVVEFPGDTAAGVETAEWQRNQLAHPQPGPVEHLNEMLQRPAKKLRPLFNSSALRQMGNDANVEKIKFGWASALTGSCGRCGKKL